MWNPWPGPQTAAFECQADELFYGGAAGSGKSELTLGLVATQHTSSIIYRREYPQLRGLIQRSHELFDSVGTFNSQENLWKIGRKRIEFGAVQYETDVQKYQGRPHDCICFDELTHFCIHPDTDVLTNRGWVRIQEVTTSDRALAMDKDGMARYERISATHEFDYDGPLISTKNGSIRYRVTPNHNMVVVPLRSERWRFVMAKDMPVYPRHPFSKPWEGEPVDARVRLPEATGRGLGRNANTAIDVDVHDWAEFMGWYVSEGSCFETGARSGPKVSIRQTVRNESLDRLMERLPWRSKWYNRGGYLITSRQLFALLKPMGNRYEKRVPRWILDATSDVVLRFWEAFVAGGGSIRKGGGISIELCNKGLRDDCQEIAAKRGYRSTAGECVTTSGHKVYRLSVHGRKSSPVEDRPSNRHVEQYSGKVYCLTVEPSHTFLVRVQGRLMWTGNSQYQYQFLSGWLRTVIPGQRCRIVCTGNPPTDDTGIWVIDYWGPWLDKNHPNPAEPGELRWYVTSQGQSIPVESGDPVGMDGETHYPKSRTFIPGSVFDNPYLVRTGYVSTLQALPEPLRSKLLYGDFSVSAGDNPWQVIPSEWIRAAQRRWEEAGDIHPTELTALGVDVARGGIDNTILAPKYGPWFDHLRVVPGVETDDGPKVAALVQSFVESYLEGCIDDLRESDGIELDESTYREVVEALRKKVRVNIDPIGVGTSPLDILKANGLNVVPVNFAKASHVKDKSGKYKLRNLRSEVYWKFREALDPDTGSTICLPPDRMLLQELVAHRWGLTTGGILIEAKDDIKERLGRSPDRADAVVMAHHMDSGIRGSYHSVSLGPAQSTGEQSRTDSETLDAWGDRLHAQQIQQHLGQIVPGQRMSARRRRRAK